MADDDFRSPVVIPAPTLANHPATKGYVDTALAGFTPGSSTLRGATDYDDTTPPADGQFMIWINSISKFGARTVGPEAVGAAAAGHTHAAPDLSGYVPTARQVLAGAGLTGGGTLSADRTLAVAYGSGSGTAVQGNDARVTADQAAATASIRTLGTGAAQAAAGNHAHDLSGYSLTSHNHDAAYSLTGHVHAPIAPVAVAGTTGNVTFSISGYPNGQLFIVTMGAARTFTTVTGAADGQTFRVMFVQDATGSRVLTHTTTATAGAFRFGSTLPAVVLSTLANAKDIVGYTWDNALQRFLVVALQKGF
jgi:hypothetical protein